MPKLGDPSSKIKGDFENAEALIELVIDRVLNRSLSGWQRNSAGAPILSRRVFVVHGHDEGAREAVARFLALLDFEPVILHEQPDRGRTIIEKVEDHGEVGFAVVLLTPDDLGKIKGTSRATPRARQNVILELGYFIGRLGRNRVCALKRGELEIPSDFGGIVYKPFDNTGGWKQALGRELQMAGYAIDWNKVMR